MIEAIQHRGVFVSGCTISGEARKDEVFPAHAGGIQLSRDRFLFAYATRGWRGTDEDRSIIYQLRRDRFDGPILREGCVARINEEWDPFGDGSRLLRLHGQPQAFGLPKSAIIAGQTPSHANLFALKWRVNACGLNRETGLAENRREQAARLLPAMREDWMQFRLNEAEDDIEVLQPPRMLCERGYLDGPHFCRHEALFMHPGMAQPVPYNAEASEWIGAGSFGFVPDYSGWKSAAMRFAFQPATGLYEWVETGPLIGDRGRSLIEPSILRWKMDWVIALRAEWWESNQAERRGPVWVRQNDPFADVPTLSDAPHIGVGPLSAYRCQDGAVRVLCGRDRDSPRRWPRDPLYCVEVNPDQGFAVTEARVVFDSVQAGLPFRPEAGACVDMGKLLPHAGGREQLIVHRVRTAVTRENKVRDSHGAWVTVNEIEKQHHGIYGGVLRYDSELPGEWRFV